MISKSIFSKLIIISCNGFTKWNNALSAAVKAKQRDSAIYMCLTIYRIINTVNGRYGRLNMCKQYGCSRSRFLFAHLPRNTVAWLLYLPVKVQSVLCSGGTLVIFLLSLIYISRLVNYHNSFKQLRYTDQLCHVDNQTTVSFYLSTLFMFVNLRLCLNYCRKCCVDFLRGIELYSTNKTVQKNKNKTNSY